MTRTITLTGLTAGAVTEDGKTMRLRATDADGEVHIELPVEPAAGIAELIIRLAHDAAKKSGEDEDAGGFVVDSIEWFETDEAHTAVLRFWLGQTPFQFLLDEIALSELQRFAQERSEAIRKSRS